MVTRIRALRRSLPPEVFTLAALALAGAASALLGALFPLSDQAPVHLNFAFAAAGALLCAGLLVAGERTPAAALHVVVVLAIVLDSALVGASKTTGGQMVTAFFYPWIGMYAALFFSARAATAHTALILVGFGAGLLVAGLPAALSAWLIVCSTVSVAVRVLNRLSRRLQAQADTDQLTGLLNRHAFARAAAREHAIAARTGDTLSLGLIDLDDFKLVNDQAGHAAGDRLLADLGAAWRKALRPGDLLSRHGGDEFVILFPATSPGDAEQVLRRLAGVHDARWTAGVVAWLPDEPLEACLSRVDKRLYEAKAERAPARPLPAARPALP